MAEGARSHIPRGTVLTPHTASRTPVPHSPPRLCKTLRLQTKPKEWSVADMGCGEGKLALMVPNKVHSFDLHSLAPHITACDMARVPLKDASVDCVVYCLSLMGSNYLDFLCEGIRILKPKARRSRRRRLGVARLGSARFGSARLGSARLGSAGLGQTRPD